MVDSTVLRSHEQILLENGIDGLLQAKVFLPREMRKTRAGRPELGVGWCDDCLELSWELQKAHVLYKHVKKEALACIPLAYGADPKALGLQKAWAARKHSCDAALQEQRRDAMLRCSLEVDPGAGGNTCKRYNMKQRRELLHGLQLCVSAINRADAAVDRLLGKWLYAEDIADYRNVEYTTLTCRLSSPS